MSIKLQFFDDSLDCNLDDLKIFPTIMDFIDLGSVISENTVIPIQDEFSCEDMKILLKLMEDYKEIFDIQKHYAESVNNRRAIKKYVYINYKIILLSEYLGYDLFDCNIDGHVFNLNLPDYKQSSIKNDRHNLKYKNYSVTSTYADKKDLPQRPPDVVKGFLLVKNSIIDQRYFGVNKFEDEYSSRIKINFDNINWNIIEKYFNSCAIKPYIKNFCKSIDKKYIKLVPEDQKQSLIKILDMVVFTSKQTKISKPYKNKYDPSMNPEDYIMAEMMTLTDLDIN